MKFPSDFEIIGEKVILIPYKESHVNKYHEWMRDPEILRLTGSERLTFDQEKDMQREWAADDKKCTFIIMDKSKYESTQEELQSIVGDTNLFLEAQSYKCDQETDATGCNKSAEIEVMIAETWARRKGLAKEAIQLMIRFGFEKLQQINFIAKIKCDNQPSIDLFQNLGFKQMSQQPNVFNEFILELELELNCL